MRNCFQLLLICFGFTLSAQTVQDTLVPDPDYLEDQFYVGVTYNLLLNKPERVKQRNLSYGLQAGFIKDIPLNRKRNVAIGLGLGYAVNSYYTNLRAVENGENFTYAVIPDDFSYKRNKIETHLVELPIEFRLRNSNPVDYKFWRFYAGMKLGYIVGSRSKFVSKDLKDSFYNTDTDNFRYGLMVNMGYNTFTIHAYYALNKLFEPGKANLEGEEIGMTPLRIGLIFYIL